MASTPLIAALQEALVGLVIGVALALVGRLALVRANLRWTWALPPTLVGVLCIGVGGVFESWSYAIAWGGLWTGWWTFTDERRDRESGGDARRRMRAVVGPADVLAARRNRARVKSGRVAARDGFLLGFGARSKPVSVRFGGTSGRHGLLLGASGSGKSNALLWCVARHIDDGLRRGGDRHEGRPAARPPAPARGGRSRAGRSTAGRSTAATAGTRSRAATAAS